MLILTTQEMEQVSGGGYYLADLIAAPIAAVGSLVGTALIGGVALFNGIQNAVGPAVLAMTTALGINAFHEAGDMVTDSILKGIYGFGKWLGGYGTITDWHAEKEWHTTPAV